MYILTMFDENILRDSIVITNVIGTQFSILGSTIYVKNKPIITIVYNVTYTDEELAPNDLQKFQFKIFRTYDEVNKFMTKYGLAF